MACKNVCRLCKRLIISNSVTFASGALNIDIPAGNYLNGEKYCIVIAQPIPNTATVNALTYISIGGTGSYRLVNKCCEHVVASALRTRTKYSTVVVTDATGGVFKLLGNVANETVNNKVSIP